MTPELEAEIDEIVDRAVKRVMRAHILTYEFVREQFVTALGEVSMAAIKSPPTLEAMRNATEIMEDFRDKEIKKQGQKP